MRWGIDVAENQQARIEYIRDAMMLAFDLGPRIVVVQISPATHRRRFQAREFAQGCPLGTRNAWRSGWHHGGAGNRLRSDPEKFAII